MTDWRAGLVVDEETVDEHWREHLAAARTPTTSAQDAWDRDWCRWRDIALRAGRGQRAAIEIAWTRTEDQHGTRPDNEKEETR